MRYTCFILAAILYAKRTQPRPSLIPYDWYAESLT